MKTETSTIIDDLEEFIGRYVVMEDEQRLVVALWVIHTYCLDAFEQTPYLAITSPEKQCGKSRLLEVLDQVVAKPWMTILPSEAVAYRKIAAEEPTLLLDEVDTIFNPRSADKYEALRALLNAGHRRGARVPRCLGTGTTFVEFDVFCPKVIAGIGTLPDTVADRSIPIRLARRRRDEEVERFLIRDVEPIAKELKERVTSWAEQHGPDLLDAIPEMPEQLSDRMQEGSEGLVAIADSLSRGDDARDALVYLLTAERLDSQETWQVRLLADLRTIFESKKYEREAGIFSAQIIEELHLMAERGWADYYGRGIAPKDLASLLGHYDIHSGQVRMRNRTKTKKGYKRDDLYEKGWSRYLTEVDVKNNGDLRAS